MKGQLKAEGIEHTTGPAGVPILKLRRAASYRSGRVVGESCSRRDLAVDQRVPPSMTTVLVSKRTDLGSRIAFYDLVTQRTVVGCRRVAIRPKMASLAKRHAS